MRIFELLKFWGKQVIDNFVMVIVKIFGIEIPRSLALKSWIVWLDVIYTTESVCALEQKTIKNGIAMRNTFELCSIMTSKCSTFHISIIPQRCKMTPLSLQNPSEKMPPDISYVSRPTVCQGYVTVHVVLPTQI